MTAVANHNQAPPHAHAANDASTASREFLERQAFEAFRAFVAAFQQLLDPATPRTLEPPVVATAPVVTTEASSDVMTADQVAEFLGVDRNTVYDFAGRGVIPHRRLGKRLLFRRTAVLSWLDTSLCSVASKART